MQKNVRSLSTLTFAAVIMLCLVVRIAPTSASPTNSNGVYPPGLVPGPDPPLNPTALLQIGGDYTYTAAGTALRNTGSGTITVSYTGTVVAAYLIWGIINTDQTGLASASINGHTITGTFQSDDTSPCWGGGQLWVYAADVTSYVTNGANSVSGFASGFTNGANPWSEYGTPLDDGASLVVVTTGTVSNNIYVYTGAYTEPYSGNPLTSTFNHGAADATNAQVTFIVADGQLPNNFAEYNGVTIDSNAFPGSDPKTSTATWSYGNLWDTKTYSSLTETLGATSDTASIGSDSSDCLTWAAQVISIPSTATVPPIGIPPTNSVPEFGASPIMVAAIGAVLLALLVRSRQSLKIHTA